eukprot:9615261-Lingulodinium_polyedra.AAC.1
MSSTSPSRPHAALGLGARCPPSGGGARGVGRRSSAGGCCRARGRQPWALLYTMTSRVPPACPWMRR